MTNIVSYAAGHHFQKFGIAIYDARHAACYHALSRYFAQHFDHGSKPRCTIFPFTRLYNADAISLIYYHSSHTLTS